MAQILQPYELSISSVENSPQDVLLDLFYSLERLKSTTDDIFGKIEKRVVDERDRINQINLIRINPINSINLIAVVVHLRIALITCFASQHFAFSFLGTITQLCLQ